MKPALPALALAIVFFATSAHAVIWKYNDERIGQEDWGDLDPGFSTCKNGTRQSPIDLGQRIGKKMPPLNFNYRTMPTSFRNDRYTMLGVPDAGLMLKDGSHEYQLIEVMLRTPGEHEISGQYALLEVQLVHEDKDGKKLIVSVAVDSGKPNEALESMMKNFPKTRKELPRAPIAYDKLLPAGRGYYAYDGSISYPPCTEGVQIRVMSDSIEASDAQLEGLIRKLGRNGRMVQPLNDRIVTKSE